MLLAAPWHLWLPLDGTGGRVGDAMLALSSNAGVLLPLLATLLCGPNESRGRPAPSFWEAATPPPRWPAAGNSNDLANAPRGPDSIPQLVNPSHGAATSASVDVTVTPAPAIAAAVTEDSDHNVSADEDGAEEGYDAEDATMCPARHPQVVVYNRCVSRVHVRIFRWHGESTGPRPPTRPMEYG